MSAVMARIDKMSAEEKLRPIAYVELLNLII